MAFAAKRTPEVIRADIVATPAFRLGRYIQALDRSAEMVALNFAELFLAIRATADLNPSLWFPPRPRATDYPEAHDQALWEVSRRFDNFLASAISRSERTERAAGYFRRLDPQLQADHRLQLEALFATREYRLVEYLRNHSLHRGSHGLWAEVVFRGVAESSEPPTQLGLMSRVFVEIPKFSGARNKRDKGEARFIASLPERMEIAPLARDFNRACDTFMGWYRQRLFSLYQANCGPLEQLREELRATWPDANDA